MINSFNKGYTLLFAVLVAALVLAIGISILNISKKEFLLATSFRDSSEAFYNADAAIECAVLGDQYGDFIKTVPTLSKCALPYTFLPFPDTDTSNVNDLKYSFDLNFGTSYNGPCANVTVRKTPTRTDITALGYNKGWKTETGRCEVPSVKRVERAIHYYY